jgi:hypothetical protein
MIYNIFKKITIALFLFIISLATQAQSLIDEDMLDNIEENAKGLWSETTQAFISNTTPEKYKDESAIIIGFKRNVTIDKKSRIGFFTRGERSLLFDENIHFKIKLNDKNAVTKFTEVYFRYSDKNDGFSAKIIKPDGSSNNVSLSDAVSVENTSDVPEFYKSFFDQETSGQRRYFKVAIPDLEINDILEYVTLTKSKLNVAYSGYIEFSPQYEICNKNYPVLFNQIAIETDDKSFFKSMSLNGAPSFKKEVTTDNEFYRYVFTDNDRATEKDVNFINTLQAYPVTKFQVIYANNANAKGALIGAKGEIKTGFTKEELCKKAWEDYGAIGDYNYSTGYGIQMGVQTFINELWAGLKKLGAKKWEEKEYIEKAYYRLRNIVVYRSDYMSDKMFAYIFSSLLFQRDIKSDVIISISNNVGKLKDILFDQEIKYAVRVNNVIYHNATDFSNPGESVQSFLGNDGYIIEKVVKGVQKIEDFTFPDASIADNNAEYVFTSSLNSDMSTLSVSRTSTHRGISKTNHISDALKYTTYMLDDYKYYGGEDPTEKMRGKQEEEYIKSINAIKESYKTSKPTHEKSLLQNEFGNTVTFKNFLLISDGRSNKNKNLSFTEDFELTGMVRKAGKKYLVNVAGLVGSQLQIKKEERVRKYDINVDYARSLFWTINFKIPEGYTTEGLKELSTEVTNETGTYATIAEEKDGMVIIKVKKIYKKANIPKEKWQEMLAFVDAAYNNSFKYILLKPKN